jgi:monoterpene epsilon-lactone hydrolase
LFADLTGLAPLLVQVGTAEILLSDSERLAAAARRAGVRLTLHIEPGAPHVYPSMRDDDPARTATDMIGTFLRERLNTSPRHRDRG